MTEAVLDGLFRVVAQGVLGAIYLGGAITCLVLGLRKAGAGAWLGLAAFGLLLVNQGLAALYAYVILPQAVTRAWPMARVMLAQSCCSGGLTSAAALLLIIGLVKLAGQRSARPEA